MQTRFSTCLSVLMLGALGLAHAGSPPVPLPICDDVAGWPPYTFADPKNPQAVTGASADLMTGLLRRAGYAPQITLLPWKRCLGEVEAGRAALLLNASFNEERAQKFLVSKPYYSINSALFYSSAKYPVPPKMVSMGAMKKYRYCGLLGYNYTMYDIPPEQLDTGARDETSRFEMLRMGRCDFVLGDVEIIKAFAAMGQLNLAGTAYVSIPGTKPKEFHALVSRAWPGGETLLKHINDGIAASKADKSFDKVFKKYGL